jgi:hypothetical protein
LSGPDHELENYVPSGRRPAITGEVEREAGKLRGCFNEVSRLESRRRRKIDALRAKAKQDDISKHLSQRDVYVLTNRSRIAAGSRALRAGVPYADDRGGAV